MLRVAAVCRGCPVQHPSAAPMGSSRRCQSEYGAVSIASARRAGCGLNARTEHMSRLAYRRSHTRNRVVVGSPTETSRTADLRSHPADIPRESRERPVNAGKPLGWDSGPHTPRFVAPSGEDSHGCTQTQRSVAGSEEIATHLGPYLGRTWAVRQVRRGDWARDDARCSRG